MPFRSEDEYNMGTVTLLNRLLEDIVYDNINSTGYNNVTYDNATYGYEDNYGYNDGKKKKEPVYIDYSILSVGILTLGLILFVEVSRHWIDHRAHGKPFFTAVLLMLYSELATLGLVEFAVFLLLKYYDGIDKDKKEVFGDVHFALFYTALFNAIQSTLTAILTTNASHRLWVRTEALELDHYVEIREEYERISNIVNLHQATTRLGKWIRNCLLLVRRPGLRRKYHNLRIQVRFHELRLQFLENNGLPLSLKVSDYLKRSELGVLIGLVHISGTAWLFLTGGLALLYFILGMVGYKTADVDVLGTCMTAVFFSILLLFIIISIALQYKMEHIFQAIMKMKIDQTSDKQEGMMAQKSLFWFESPDLVISLIQFMNFGYAIALAVVIMYWPYLTLVDPYLYLLPAFGCYIIFLYNLSVLLPQFTLCTSLGFLTNSKQLQETVAHHRLEEARQQQRRKLIEKAIQNHSVIALALHEDTTEALTDGSSEPTTQKTVASVMRTDAGGIIPVSDPKEKLLAELVKSDTKALREQLPKESQSRMLAREKGRRDRKKAVSDGVAAMRGMSGAASGPLVDFKSKLDADAPAAKSRTSGMHRVEGRRHRREKTLSQPKLIKGWQDITGAEKGRKKSSQALDDADAEQKRLKSSSESGVIKAWQDSQNVDGNSGPHFKEGDADGPRFVKKGTEHDSTPKWKKERAARLAERQNFRNKSQSASAVIQSWRDFAVTDEKSDEIMDSPVILPDIRSDDGSEPDYAITRTGQTIEVRSSHPESKVSFADDIPREERSNAARHVGIIDATKGVVDLADAMIIENGILPALPSKASKQETNTDDDLDAKDDDTVNTDKSIGNLSDVDVVETMRGFHPRDLIDNIDPWHTRCLSRFSLDVATRDMKLYFLGSYYRTVSHVFGTLIVFVIIGHRVEAFVAKSGYIIRVDYFHWATNLLNMFWSEVVWLLCFTIGDFIVLILFPLWRSRNIHEQSLSIAAVIDLILTWTVMTLLLVAESQRCCVGDDPSSGRVRVLAASIGQDYEFEDECTCGRWGSRTYTGLGMIEPFTSIIVLRIFRFVLATFLVKKMGIDYRKENEESSEDTDKEHSSSHHSHEHGDHGHGDHGHGLGGATALELWERAITQHPEIVEKYGQLSGELLQAMLGLHVEIHSEDVSTLSQAGSSQTEPRDGKEKSADSEKPETWQSHIKLTGPQYAKLSPETQGLIIAGRLGKPVKSMNGACSDRNLPAGGWLPTVEEGISERGMTERADVSGLVEFEIDTVQMIAEQNCQFSFIAPFARLVRSMRRCDRRHLPLLTKWVCVDVVMTQFEIVYFEATDRETTQMDGQSQKNENAVLSALRATKGGKGLRLCDVAAGRKVVGHLDLADVTEIHVEQDDDVVSDVSLLETAAERYHCKNDLAVEYWHEKSHCTPYHTDPTRSARSIRWTVMKEERLKLTTRCGTLVLRFFSDLEGAENDKIGDTERNLNKDIALQWAETVARIVGKDNLKQHLPHFGENNEDELRDFLEVAHFHNKEAEKAMKKSEREKKDLKTLNGEGVNPNGHESVTSSAIKKSVLGRPKSFGEVSGGSERPVPRPSLLSSFRRSVSMGQSELAKDDDGDAKIEALSIV